MGRHGSRPERGSRERLDAVSHMARMPIDEKDELVSILLEEDNSPAGRPVMPDGLRLSAAKNWFRMHGNLKEGLSAITLTGDSEKDFARFSEVLKGAGCVEASFSFRELYAVWHDEIRKEKRHGKHRRHNVEKYSHL